MMETLEEPVNDGARRQQQAHRSDYNQRVADLLKLGRPVSGHLIGGAVALVLELPPCDLCREDKHDTDYDHD